MAMPQAIRRPTEAEYLEGERLAEFKSEFHDGEVFAMEGGTVWHSLISSNAIREIGLGLKGGPCRVFNSDLRLKVEATGLITYPDLSVVCGQVRYLPGTDDTLTNPILLVEVLSDSTEAYDRGTKFRNYRQIPTLREYLLVSQKEPRIEQFVLQDDKVWAYRVAEGLEASLELPSLQVQLAMREVFGGVEFGESPLRPPTLSPSSPLN